MKMRKPKRGPPYESLIGWICNLQVWWRNQKGKLVVLDPSHSEQIRINEPQFLLAELARWLSTAPAMKSAFREIRGVLAIAASGTNAMSGSKRVLLRVFRIVAATIEPRASVLSAATLHRLLQRSKKSEHMLGAFHIWLGLRREPRPTIGDLLQSPNAIVRRQGKAELERHILEMLRLSQWVPGEKQKVPPWLANVTDHPADVHADGLLILASNLLCSAAMLHPELNMSTNGDASTLPVDLQLIIAATEGARREDDQHYYQRSAAFAAFALDELASWEFAAQVRVVANETAEAKEPGTTLVIELPAIRMGSQRTKQVMIQVSGGNNAPAQVAVTRRQAEVLDELRNSPAGAVLVDNRTITNAGKLRGLSLAKRVPQLLAHLHVTTVPGKPNKRIIHSKNLRILVAK